MSKNKNRSKLNKAEDSRTYDLIYLNYMYPDYWDEGRYYHQSKGMFKWKRKQISLRKAREYRSWKYNRKTQWK